VASCHRPSAAAWPGQPATGGDWRRGGGAADGGRGKKGRRRDRAESCSEEERKKLGRYFAARIRRRKQEKPMEERRKPLPMELEREAVSDRIHSKRSEPSDGKSDGRHRRVTWPAEEQEVVYRNKEYGRCSRWIN